MRILSVKHVVPSVKVYNDDILNRVRQESAPYLSESELNELTDLISRNFEKAGTHVRYVRDKNERALDLTIQAGVSALKDGDIGPKDIDLLLYVGVGRGWVEPSMANVFQDKLGLKNATAFDILDACASWLRAMHVADQFIKSGTYKRVMIISSEFNVKEYIPFAFRSIKDLEFMFAGLTISEAGTATIVEADDRPDNFYFTFKTFGDQHNLCKIPLPQIGQFCDNELIDNPVPLQFYSFSEKLTNFALGKITKHFLSDKHLRKYKPDLSFGHAASEAMFHRVAAKIGVTKDQCVSTHAEFGNTVSSSVPLAMSIATERGQMKRGQNVLIGFGSAGFTSGLCAFTH